MNKGNLSITLIVSIKADREVTQIICVFTPGYQILSFPKTACHEENSKHHELGEKISIYKLQMNQNDINLKLKVFEAFCKVVYTEVKEELGAEEM